jgi:sugar lactone lactonase YvrE
MDVTAGVRGLALALLVVGEASMGAQTAQAPYLLPYTLSTYVGANGQYTNLGSACPSGGGFIQNASGDGCTALLTSINGEPHDVRVDARGNVFYIDNTGTTSGVIHKVSPFGFLSTLYVGSEGAPSPNGSCYTGSSYTPPTSKYGDGCQATDGIASNSGIKTTGVLKAIRGLSTSPNGDLGIAGYNDYLDHDVLFTTGVMKMIAGKGATGTADGAVGTSAENQSRGIGFDPLGNTAYVADTGNNTLRQIVTLAGTPTTTTLTAANASTKRVDTAYPTLINIPGGTSANTAILNAPEDAQTDSFGNIYIADQGNNVVRAIYKGGSLPWFPAGATVGYIYTVAGLVSAGLGVPPPAVGAAPTYNYPTDGSTPTVSPLSVAMTVRKLSVDVQNNLYLADSAWNVIWFIDHATGQMRLLAGRYISTSTAASLGQPALGCGNGSTIGDGCPGPLGQFYSVAGTTATSNPDLAVSADRLGNLYVTDSEGGTAATARIRKLVSGTVFPAIGTNMTVTQSLLMHFGPGDSPAASNAFTLTGSDYALVGTPVCTVNTPGTSTGGFAVGDNTDDCVVKIAFTPSHAGVDNATLTATSALGGVASFVLSGSGTAATLAYDPGNIAQLGTVSTAAQGVALDGAGNAYVADTANNQVLFVSTSGASRVLVPASAGLKSPSAVALGVDGSVYIADTGNNLIRKLSSTGTLTTYGGGGANGGTATAACPAPSDSFNNNCIATQAIFKAPAGLAADTLGNLYVADTGNNVIRVIASNGFVAAFAGGGSSYCDSCSATTTKLYAPTGLAIDPIGNYLYVADTGENRVRKIYLSTTYTSSGTGSAVKASSILVNPITTVAGNSSTGVTVSGSGLATGSALTAPTGVAVDASGTVYIADTGNSAIRMVTPVGGIITTIAGSLGTSGSGAAGSSAAITASSYTTHCSTNLTTVTLTAVNNFTAGLSLTFSGLTGATFLNGQNLAVLSSGLSATTFQVAVPGLLSCPPGTTGADSTPIASADSGTASYSTSATSIQLAAPSAIAVTPTGNLVIADAGNGRLLVDSRSQVSYNFGPIAVSNPATSSSAQPFTVTNIGNSTATINAFSSTPANSAFTLTGAATATGVPACTSSSSTAYAPGTICNANAVFTPTTAGQQSATFTDLSVTGVPSITLSGDGAAALTSTTSTVVQTAPTTGNPQFAGTFTLQAVITASGCNAFAPACSPTGTVQFTVDNAASGAPIALSALASPANSSAASTNLTGLTVGQHSIACIFKADSADNAYYAGSSCPTITISIDRGGTSSVLAIAAGTNNRQQYPIPTASCTVAAQTTSIAQKGQYICTDTTLTATVSATTAGTPTGSVTFYVKPSGSATTTSLGTVSLTTSGSNATASLALYYVVDTNGNLVSDTTLPPGTYTLSCTYNGDANYATSNCAGQTFTVLPQTPALLLAPEPCVPSTLYAAGTQTPQYSYSCSGATAVNNLPTVAVGQGSTTDVTLFVIPSNTVSGTLNFSCSGLPANSICTFSPQTLTVSPSLGYTTPLYVDVTLWTDIPPGVTPTKAEMKLPGQTGGGTQLALMLGWPLSLLGFIGLLRFRRAGRSRGLTLTALALLMVGSTLTLSGCAGPGIYHPNLTPVGSSTVTITVTGANISPQTTMVGFTVTPGLTGQQ